MAGAGRGDGKGPGVGKLESQIYCIKYTLFCFNVVLWNVILKTNNQLIRYSGTSTSNSIVTWVPSEHSDQPHTDQILTEDISKNIIIEEEDNEPPKKKVCAELQEETLLQSESDKPESQWKEWNPTALKTKKHPVLSKPKEKKPFDRLTEEKLEIAQIQKKLITEEFEQKLIQRKLLEKELEHKDLFGVSIFALCLWICVEPGFNEFMSILSLQKYFIGIYIILLASLIIMVVAFLGCGAALMENVTLLYAYIGTQIATYVFGLVGATVVLDFSTYDSSIQPLIKNSILNLMNNPQHEDSRSILRMVQEGIGCCGADGPMDYITLNKPFPAECRDSVTGNAYFHGCVDELTWYLEGKTGWLAGIVLAACMIAVVNAVISLVLIHAVRKEEDEAITYK